MILNISRMKNLMMCPAAAFYRYHVGLSGTRSMNLVDGSAFHKGVALGQASKDWAQAVVAAKELFDVDLSAAGLLPEEDFLVDAHWRVVKKGIELYQADWQDFGMTVVQPECTFEVDIPGTEHNDITLHWYNSETHQEVWGMPDSDSIMLGAVKSPHNTPDAPSFTGDPRHCGCYRPHRLVGRTDGILSWQGHLWLQEHKTSSIKDDRFWKQWHTDIQLTGYIYGVQKATGMRPKGVVLNMIYKPSEGQIAAWNSKRKNPLDNKDVTHYMEYQREIFLRTDEQLAKFEKMFISRANEWERRILENDFPDSPSNGHCQAYNRTCDYYDITVGNTTLADATIDMARRDPDYVDVGRAEQLIQITGVN